MPPAKPEARVRVQTPNVPGYSASVDKAKYDAMRAALLKVVPKRGGITQSEMMAAVKRHLPESLFPGGAKSEWWTKCVQLDLEVRGVLARDATAKPLRWKKA